MAPVVLSSTAPCGTAREQEARPMTVTLISSRLYAALQPSATGCTHSSKVTI